MNKYNSEKSLLWLGSFATLAFVVGMVFTVIAPVSFGDLNHPKVSYEDPDTSPDQAHYKLPYTEQQERGRLVYQREGCMYCHSQQIRPLKAEMMRYGLGTSPAPASDPREYNYDEPHFFGTKRNGPDLFREGGKYSDDWQLSHLLNPAQMTPGSIMPAFRWLFTNENPADPSSPYIPTDDAKDLVAYIQTLGADRQVFDPTLNDGKGAWRGWLRKKDAVQYQEFSETQVHEAAHPVTVPGGERASAPAGQ
jgi:cbb3-type cytochrome oxidase cytochrome c subunit